MNTYNKTPAIITIIALLVALGDLPYGYYQLLRFIVCGVGIYAAYTAHSLKRTSWVWLMGIIALIFNPIISFHLDRDLWQVLDVLAAIIFIVSIFMIKPAKGKR